MRPLSLLRWLRAALLTAVVVCFGTVAHVSADGRMPGVLGLATLVLVVLAASAAGLSRPAGRVRLVLMTVLGQAGVHVVLTMTAGHGGHPAGPAVARVAPPTSTAGTGRRTGSLHEFYLAGQPVPPTDGGPDPIAHLLADVTSAQAPMMLAHLGAAVLVGLWLAAGEQALWAVLALTAAPLLAAVGVLAAAILVPAPPRHRPAPVRTAPAPLLPAIVARAVVRRGPPVLLAA